MTTQNLFLRLKPRKRPTAAVCLALLGAALIFGGCKTTGESSNVKLQLSDLPVAMTLPQAGTYLQQIDHNSSIGTFAQSYWYSTQFVKGTNAPVIFFLCGESACSGRYALAMADTARVLGAAVVVLEHRYYGASLPYRTPTLANMKYLTIANALEDAAGFELWARANLPLPPGGWLAVGGSYPGMLAAFLREKHPELVVGAWASSAPVNVQLSFGGYDAIVARALGPSCATLARQTLVQGDSLYQSGAAPAVMAGMFGTGYQTGNEADYMLYLTSPFENAAQYGTSGALCASLTQNPADPLSGLIAFLHPPLAPDTLDKGAAASAPSIATTGTKTALSTSDDEPDLSLNNFGQAWLLSPVNGTGSGVASTGGAGTGSSFDSSPWVYQVCTEVGFYQIKNTGSPDSIFSSLMTEDYFNQMCDRLVHTRPNIAQTSALYYQPILDGTVSNIFFTNGSLDPWSSLSFTNPLNLPHGVNAFVVANGSHCSDLTNLRQGMALGIFEAHREFQALAAEWLASSNAGASGVAQGSEQTSVAPDPYPVCSGLYKTGSASGWGWSTDPTFCAQSNATELQFSAGSAGPGCSCRLP